ncbi:MAG: hypothetical protein GX447_05865 [Elusimicrobia bacterium]|nr:hypothetical protein [Elusimicrobiota bacterium]
MNFSSFSWIKKNGSKMPSGEWFIEFFTKGEFHCHQISSKIAHYKTEFQEATLIKTHTFGKVLVLDGETQSSEYDEFIYHEGLVFPALYSHKKPKKALILGGGEGATARDILKRKSIEKVVMADIDHNILDFARKHLHTWHKGSFEDERMILLCQDAKKCVENTKLKFDLIYSDLPSPIEGGPAFSLYTLEFYRKMKNIMQKDAIFAMQSGPGTPLQFELHPMIFATLSKVFKYTASYSFFIPSYDMPWTYLLASDFDFKKAVLSYSFDKRIKEYFSEGPKLLDSQNIKGLFESMPFYLKEKIRKCKKPITEKNPMFFSTSR